MKLPAARILDFDIENRPISYMGGDLTTADITAIAASFVGDSYVWCGLLGQQSLHTMLSVFRAFYNNADIVTGHFIRKHDLPLINGALVEQGMAPLEPKLTIDTKLDLINWSFQTQPKSQQELALALNIQSPKVQMTQADWREANRLEERGLVKTYERCVGDVIQHKELRLELTRRGLLRGPKLWIP